MPCAAPRLEPSALPRARLWRYRNIRFPIAGGNRRDGLPRAVSYRLDCGSRKPTSASDPPTIPATAQPPYSPISLARKIGNTAGIVNAMNVRLHNLVRAALPAAVQASCPRRRWRQHLRWGRPGPNCRSQSRRGPGRADLLLGERPAELAGRPLSRILFSPSASDHNEDLRRLSPPRSPPTTDRGVLEQGPHETALSPALLLEAALHLVAVDGDIDGHLLAWALRATGRSHHNRSRV